MTAAEFGNLMTRLRPGGLFSEKEMHEAVLYVNAGLGRIAEDPAAAAHHQTAAEAALLTAGTFLVMMSVAIERGHARTVVKE